MNYVMVLFLSAILSVPLFCMEEPQIPQIGVHINEIENQSNKNVSIVGSRTMRTWDIPPGDKDRPFVRPVDISLNEKRPDLTITSRLGQVRLELVGTNLTLISSSGVVPLSFALYKNSKIVIRPNGFIELVSTKAATPKRAAPGTRPSLPLLSPAVSRAPAPVVRKPETQVYTSLADFILDDHPRQLTHAESSSITGDFENLYMSPDSNWVDSFWVDYNDLRNDDGSVLSPAQKNAVIVYLKKHSQHATDNGFRFANNNYEVLGGPAGQNPVWKLMHNYLRRLLCLVNRLKGIGSGPCPSNKNQLLASA